MSGTRQWRALIVSDERAVAHVWEPTGESAYPNALRTVCKSGGVAALSWLEPERASRQRCKRCLRHVAGRALFRAGGEAAR